MALERYCPPCSVPRESAYGRSQIVRTHPSRRTHDRASTASAQGVPTATLHVQVFGPFGEKILNPVLHLYTVDRKQDLAGGQQDSTIIGVPYGRYVLLAYAGSEAGEREVTVNTKEAWVRLGLAFPSGERAWPPGDLTVSGDMKPPPGVVRRIGGSGSRAFFYMRFARPQSKEAGISRCLAFG